MSYDVEMDPYQDGPKTSTIISLLAALCIFGGLYIFIPRYLETTPIIETTSVVADLDSDVDPVPNREHPTESLPVRQDVGQFDALFSSIEKSMQREHCMHFVQLDYTRAWLHTCAKKSLVNDACTAALSRNTSGTAATQTQILNQAMSTVCGCTLTKNEGRAIDDMLSRGKKICEQKYI